MSEITQRQRAEAEVEKLLQFIEATSGRKLRFRPICNLNTGKQESPSERLAGWYEKIVATARQEALAMYRNEIAVKLQLDHAGNKMYSRAYLIQVLDDVDIALDRLAREGVTE